MGMGGKAALDHVDDHLTTTTTQRLVKTTVMLCYMLGWWYPQITPTRAKRRMLIHVHRQHSFNLPPYPPICASPKHTWPP
jgi:hypothetical protein